MGSRWTCCQGSSIRSSRRNRRGPGPVSGSPPCTPSSRVLQGRFRSRANPATGRLSASRCRWRRRQAALQLHSETPFLLLPYAPLGFTWCVIIARGQLVVDVNYSRVGVVVEVDEQAIAVETPERIEWLSRTAVWYVVPDWVRLVCTPAGMARYRLGPSTDGPGGVEEGPTAWLRPRLRARAIL